MDKSLVFLVGFSRNDSLNSTADEPDLIHVPITASIIAHYNLLVWTHHQPFLVKRMLGGVILVMNCARRRSVLLAALVALHTLSNVVFAYAKQVVHVVASVYLQTD